MAAKKTYGLIMPKKSSAQQKIFKKPSIFDDDDDEEEDAFTAVNKSIVNESKKVFSKKQNQLEIEKAMGEDPSVYEYDSIYDEMQEKKKGKIVELSKTKDTKPKYMHNLLKAAEIRKKENERREERLVQKERKAEKGMYDDKESFVTGAYKQKMLEMQQAEEEEKRKAMIEDVMDVTKQKDLSGFHRHLLAQMTGEEAIPDNTKVTVKEEPEVKPKPGQNTSPSDKDGPPRLSELFDERDDSSDSNSSSSSSGSDSDDNGSKKRKRSCSRESDKGKRKQHTDISPSRQAAKTTNSSAVKRRQYRERSRSPEKPNYNDRRRDRDRSRDRSDRSRERRDRSRDRRGGRGRERRDRSRDRSRRDRSRERRDDDHRERRRDRSGERKDRQRDKRDRSKERQRDKSPVRQTKHKRDEESAEKHSEEDRAQDKSEPARPDKAALKAELDALREAAKKEKEASSGSIFDKRHTGDTLGDAKARYLARKQAKAKPIVEAD